MSGEPIPLDNPMFKSPRKLHLREPDYTRSLLKITPKQRASIVEKLRRLYGKRRARETFVELERVMQVYYAHKTEEMIADDKSFDPGNRFTEKDVILITYGDILNQAGKNPLRALTDFLEANTHLGINTIHILPFFPSSSDRGFAVVSYEEVDPAQGTWDEIEELNLRFKLMFDGVFNHVSSKSRWFQEFLNGNLRYRDYFIKFSTKGAVPDDYLHLILRPRTSDLLTGFSTIVGTQYVWTTFSPDQIDLNYRNTDVFIRIVEILLSYVRRGADLIRLDAVTYMWSALGTSCALLEESHTLVQLFRSILDVVAPQVALVTETNVPHGDNIGYLGNGYDEAQMVYNFALPPLVLQAFQTGDSGNLVRWSRTLESVSERSTYFNFLDSHDGIGLLPVRDLLTPAEIEAMIKQCMDYGSLVSYRVDTEGCKTPYEINTTWFSALTKPDSGESLKTQVDRFIASRAIGLVLMGVPGIYLPSLVGTANDRASVLQGGGPRNINRGRLNVDALGEKLADPTSAAHQISRRFGELIRIRIQTPAFHPNAGQTVLTDNPAVFSLLRKARETNQVVLALTNVTNHQQAVRFSTSQLGSDEHTWYDLLSDLRVTAHDNRLSCDLSPYQVSWLTPDQ